MRTLPERLQRHYAATPDRLAIVLQQAGQSDRPITYRELLNGATAYARTFAGAGVRAGEVIILILQHGPDVIFSFWGAVLHGAIPSIMPFLTEKLSPEQYRADLAALIALSRPAAVVTFPEFEREVKAAVGGGGSVRTVILTNKLDLAEQPDLDRLAGTGQKPEDIVLLQHSSGTTGLQKGVALSHQAVFNQLDAYGQAIRLNENDVIVSWLPLYHDMGLIAGFLMPILSGVPLVLSSPFDWVRAPFRLLQAVSRYRGTLSWFPNFAYNFCAQKIRDRDLQGVDLSSLRAVINCSEPVRFESHQSFYDRFKSYGLRMQALQTSYAMAENVFAVTQSDVDGAPRVEEIDLAGFMSERAARPAAHGQPALKMMSSGRCLANTRLRIVDENGHDLPDGRIGEITLQSDCMLSGYYNRPDATERALQGGWFLTGDYGFLSHGELFVSGRKKDMIIVGGKNIYPQDLESLSYEVPGVHAGRSVAFGVYNEEAGTEDAVLVVEVDGDREQERERISDLIREHVTRRSAVSPRYVKVVGPQWIVKTSSGKTARSANKEKFLRELDRRPGDQE